MPIRFRGRNYTFTQAARIVLKRKIPLLVGHVVKYFSIRKNCVVFYGMTDFDGNAWRVFLNMLSDEYFKDWKFLWITQHRDVQPPPEVQNSDRVIWRADDQFDWQRISMQTKAKLLFYEQYKLDSFDKKQRVIYMTHGFPIKNVVGEINVPSQVNYVCCPSEKYSYIQEQQFSYPKEKSINTGYPRNDALFFETDELVKLGYKKVDYAKVIIWMPTFRRLITGRSDGAKASPTGIALIDNEAIFDKLNIFCRQYNVLLIIKRHPNQDESEVTLKGKSNVPIFSDQEIREKNVCLYSLLAQTDALISDYSSVSLDYLLLDRPIAYTVSDFATYTRGFATDNPQAFMPGDKISEYNQLLLFLKNIVDGVDTYFVQRKELKTAFWDYCDGNSTQRLVSRIKDELLKL